MWLESIAVKGFRSFRDLTEVNFHRGHTAIIGRFKLQLSSQVVPPISNDLPLYFTIKCTLMLLYYLLRHRIDIHHKL
jgi:hypothetical protein